MQTRSFTVACRNELQKKAADWTPCGRFDSGFLCSSFLNEVVKELLKLVYIAKIITKIKVTPFS